MELYSWQDARTQQWRYSLLPGTNRNKSMAEITDPSNKVDSVEALKARLASLADDEYVTWRGIGQEGMEFPEQAIVAQIKDAADALNLNLQCSCITDR